MTNGGQCTYCGHPINDTQLLTTVLLQGTLFIAHQYCHELEQARDKNNACNEIDPPYTLKEYIMAENNRPAPTADSTADEVAPTRLQAFVLKHPRASRALAITGGVGTVIGGVLLTNTMRANKSHLQSAADHVGEAGAELSASVTPTGTDA